MNKMWMLWLSLAVLGCRPSPKAPMEEHGHEHAHAAPHGGGLSVLGEEAAHVETVLDPAEGRLTIYLLDGHAESPLRVSAETLTLRVGDRRWALRAVVNPLTGEKAGDSSEFTAVDPRWKGRERFDGELESLVLRGNTFSAVRISWPEGTEEHDH
jgi:hypothetical protein